MKLCRSLAALLGGAAMLCGQAALAGGPGCATCNGGGVGYAATPMHWGVPADTTYGQLAPTDWNAPASRAGCCDRPQRHMCDWWAGYCDTQRVIPCPSGSCNYGKRGWGEGYFGASLAGGCQRACNNVGCGHGCGHSCHAPACAPACGSCNACDSCAPACGCGTGHGGSFGGLFGGGNCGHVVGGSSGTASCGCGCGSGCGSGFGSFFSGLFGGGHCGNVVGGSSGAASCGCCAPSCGHACAKPCGGAPCRARQTYHEGCCNGQPAYNPPAAEVNHSGDDYYNTSATEMHGSPALQPSQQLGPAREMVPTPARPMPEINDAPPTAPALPLDISAPAPLLNDADRELDDSDETDAAPPSDEDSV